MKKLLPVLLILAVVGVGAFIFMNRGTSDTSLDSSSPSSSTSDSDTFSGTLADAVKLGVGMKCTYKVEGNEYEGYIKGKNYRGKMKTAEGNVGEVIIKDNCMWTWTTNEAQGMKLCYEEFEAEAADLWEQPQGAVGPDIAYTCLPTAVTDAKFTPPSNINFMDLDAMQEGFGY